MAAGPSGADETIPIFVFGVLGRSGTNFLSDLLCLHPDCVPAHPLDEDFLLYRADLLERWSRATAGRWHPDWGLSRSGPNRLLAALGRGLIDHLRETAEAYPETGSRRLRIVTKTPSVRCLSLFPRLFPGALAVVLLRDGRAVVESNVRSFGARYEAQMRNWAWATRTIMQTALSDRGADSPFCVVRYEDLLQRPETELRRLLDFTGLDSEHFDFERARNMPVRGSSTFQRGEEGVDWEPTARTDDFQPLRRWHDWGSGRHDRFNWLAGAEMEAVGYELTGPSGGVLHVLRNRAKDVVWRLGGARRRRSSARRRADREARLLDG